MKKHKTDPILTIHDLIQQAAAKQEQLYWKERDWGKHDVAEQHARARQVLLELEKKVADIRRQA